MEMAEFSAYKFFTLAAVVVLLVIGVSKDVSSQTPQKIDAKIDLVVLLGPRRDYYHKNLTANQIVERNIENVKDAAISTKTLFEIGEDKTRIGVTVGTIAIKCPETVLLNFTNTINNWTLHLNSHMVSGGLTDARMTFKEPRSRGAKILVILRTSEKDDPGFLRNIAYDILDLGVTIYVVTTPTAKPSIYDYAPNTTGGDPSKVFNTSDGFADAVNVMKHALIEKIRDDLCNWRVPCLYTDATQKNCEPDAGLPVHFRDDQNHQQQCGTTPKPTRAPCTNGYQEGDCWDDCNRLWPWSNPFEKRLKQWEIPPPVNCNTMKARGKMNVSRVETPPPKLENCPVHYKRGDCPTTTAETTAGPSPTTSMEESTTGMRQEGGGMPLGAIVGIAVGVIVFVVIAVFIAVVVMRKRRPAKEATPSKKSAKSEKGQSPTDAGTTPSDKKLPMKSVKSEMGQLPVDASTAQGTRKGAERGVQANLSVVRPTDGKGSSMKAEAGKSSKSTSTKSPSGKSQVMSAKK